MNCKKIGIIVAMEKELSLLLPLINNPQEIDVDGYIMYSGQVGTNYVIVMQCGIGKVNAAIGTLTLLNNFEVDIIINTGVAGGADNNIKIMDVVVGTQIAYHDVWCGPGTQYGEASNFPKFFKSDEECINLLDKIEFPIKLGLICSGDKFISSVEDLMYIKSYYPNALAVDMESAAIAQVCYLRHIQFLCIRVISDSPMTNNDNIKQYDDFWEEAPRQTFEIIKQLLHKL